VLQAEQTTTGRRTWMLFIGDDWAEDHHDVELVNDSGRKLAAARLPEGIEGITKLHELIAAHHLRASDPSNLAPASEVVIGIETDRGPWVAALMAAGYLVYAINPMSAARYRERHSTSRAKSDAGDAHLLAEIVRLDRDHHRPIAGDTAAVDAIKLLARAHQNAVRERARQTLRLRSTLLDFFPAAVQAFPDLTARDALALLERAPDPALAARLTTTRIVAEFKLAQRKNKEAKAVELQELFRAQALRQPTTLQGAYAQLVVSLVRLIRAVNEQIAHLAAAMDAAFSAHSASDIYLSQPGLGPVLGARTLGEFGDDPNRFVNAQARKNYSGQSPITRASGKKTVIMARRSGNRRLNDALHAQAFSALTSSPGARGYYDRLKARNIGHHAALRQLANKLVGILHACLKTGSPYDEDLAWQVHSAPGQLAT